MINKGPRQRHPLRALFFAFLAFTLPGCSSQTAGAISEASVIRLVVAFGCFAGSYGLSLRWWIGVMAGTLAWVYPDHGTAAMAISLAIFALWSFLRHKIVKRPSCDGDIIDVEFEVTND
jgi:hypothetical protein